jgi:hypothetical protein
VQRSDVHAVFSVFLRFGDPCRTNAEIAGPVHTLA